MTYHNTTKTEALEVKMHLSSFVYDLLSVRTKEIKVNYLHHIELHSIIFFPLRRIELNHIVLNRIEIGSHCIVIGVSRIASHW